MSDPTQADKDLAECVNKLGEILCGDRGAAESDIISRARQLADLERASDLRGDTEQLHRLHTLIDKFRRDLNNVIGE